MQNNTPFQPEDEATLKERFNLIMKNPPKTLAQLIEWSAGQDAVSRDGVFDFHSGLRMIASKDVILGVELLHISFGLQDHRIPYRKHFKTEEFIQLSTEAMVKFVGHADVFDSMKGPSDFHVFFTVKK